MRESSRRRIARTPAPDVKSWEYDHELCLLSGLLEARRAGRFNPSAETYRRQDLQNLLVLLKTRHEGYVWELKSVENKCKDLKEFWSAFKEAKDFTRATYDASSGALDMSMRKEDRLMDRGGPYTMRILMSGLTTDDEITYEAWEEIFSKD
ncbi:hypothetical protein ACHAQJ_007188 [Trichoderma viride]